MLSYLTRYPDELAWQINVTKKFIRKSSCMDKFHNFLVQETEMVIHILKETLMKISVISYGCGYSS